MTHIFRKKKKIQESMEQAYVDQLGSNVLVLDQLAPTSRGGDGDEDGEGGPKSVLSVFEVSLSRPFSDEGEVAKHVNLLVYSRDDSNGNGNGGEEEREGKGLSTTVKFTAESCAPVPIVRCVSSLLTGLTMNMLLVYVVILP